MGSTLFQIRAALQGAGQEGQNLLQVLDQIIAKMQTAGGTGVGTGSGAGYGGGGIPSNMQQYYGSTGAEGIAIPAPSPSDPTYNWAATYGGLYNEKEDAGLSWRKQLAIAGYINATANIIGNWVIPKGDKEAQQNFQNITGGISNVISTVGAIHTAALMLGAGTTAAAGAAATVPVAGWVAAGLILFLQAVSWAQYGTGIADQELEATKHRNSLLQAQSWG